MAGRRGIPRPSDEQVPPGPRRDLVLAIHDLYDAAGWPGLRPTARALRENEHDRYPGTMNHELISQLLNGNTITTLPQVRSLAMYYADTCFPVRDYQAADQQIAVLWQAAKAAEVSRPPRTAAVEVPRPAGGSPTTATPESMPPTTESGTAAGERVAPEGRRALLADATARLADARTAHGGLPIGAVEDVARTITPAMARLLKDQGTEADLNINISQRSVDCTFNQLPYRPAPGDNGLQVTAGFPRVGAQIQMAPTVGIAIDREAEHAFVIFDANVANGDALLITLAEVQSDDFAAVGGRLDQWIERKLAAQLNTVVQATRADARGNR